MQNGEGIQNFAWAFQYAGAHNILSTQWNASDKSTSAVISSFYKYLKQGESKQKALQLAKLNYLNNTDAIGAQPFFWANYILFGDATAVDIAPDFLSKFWWIPVLILLLLLSCNYNLTINFTERNNMTIYKTLWENALVYLMLFIVLLISGTVGYMILQDFSFLEALYMTTITLASVGFSETKPLDNTRKNIYHHSDIS